MTEMKSKKNQIKWLKNFDDRTNASFAKFVRISQFGKKKENKLFFKPNNQQNKNGCQNKQIMYLSLKMSKSC